MAEETVYHPKDAIGVTGQAVLVTGTAGLFLSAVQNALAKQNVGAMGVFTRTGGTAAVYAGMGAGYAFTRAASANLRQKDDTYNTMIGGFTAGALLGLKRGGSPAIVGYGTGVAIVLGLFDYGGASLWGYPKDPLVDEVARKEHLRKNRRRSVEETIAELGEGRGIYGPGYEERRRERIKQNYGIDVAP
ncbi:mitochondrial import inner membrane translocase subunit Tim17 family protein [Aulographum hederae CBS 113979]|uniref:Mitochondrial import inner membrane translocase subunit Tim17 family protein n=1 Tax=Aulographum hederae CBS 113979 TaxID=1176131 RepID=A0A6G1H302_9PEZI|nr:mitochondrial import inner membrane translocase subunit Tim17 family protein [Aulographum hederae CBS 113979]